MASGDFATRARGLGTPKAQRHRGERSAGSSRWFSGWWARAAQSSPSKRGNKYLRKLLIHEARAALSSLSKSETAVGAWLRGLGTGAHVNRIVVALAARLVTIVWAVLPHSGRFAADASLVTLIQLRTAESAISQQ